MSPIPQPTKYTNRELGIIIADMSNNIKSMSENFSKLSDTVTDLGRYKDQMDGRMKANLVWASAIGAIFMSLTAYSVNLTIKSLEQSSEQMMDKKILIAKDSMIEYVDNKEFIITK